MTRREIEQLDRSLPKPNPYTRWVNRAHTRNGKSARLIHPSGLSLFAPSLGWQVVKSFADERQPLPDCVSQEPWRRAHHSLLNPDQPDLRVALAHMLSLPASRPQSLLLQALMICNGTTCESLASVCGYEVEVIKYYDSLFCNVLDRKQDRAYIDHIYLQKSPAADLGQRRGNHDSQIDLLALAYKSRRVDAVLTAAGVAPPDREPIPLATLYQQIRRNYLLSALRGLSIREATEAENPALKPAVRIIRESQDQTPSSGQKQIPDYDPVAAIQREIEKVHRRGAGGSAEN